MKSHYRAVVIGGGVVGASVLYHLTRFGWSDVALIERAELTAGSTWHAAAGFHAVNADPNVVALQDYTINLYREIEAESGQDIGLHMTGGGNIASDPARWEWLKSAWAVFQSVGIETARLVKPDEIKAICPIVEVTGVLGGLHDSNEGHLDPYGTTHAYAGAAKKRGADIILRNRAVELKARAYGRWDVATEQGTIIAEHVVNTGRLRLVLLQCRHEIRGASLRHAGARQGDAGRWPAGTLHRAAVAVRRRQRGQLSDAQATRDAVRAVGFGTGRGDDVHPCRRLAGRRPQCLLRETDHRYRGVTDGG